MLIPYRVDVPMRRWPIANFVLIGLIVLSFALTHTDNPGAFASRMVLQDWSPAGLVGHLFLHAGILHIVGNLIFLWCFGNSICAKIGNLAFPVVFLGLGVFAGAIHLLFSRHPAVGASGAINGIVGMYFILYPKNDIRCLYFIGRGGTFAMAGFWLLVFWFACDIWGAVSGSGGTAYWAHIGGFVGGMGLATILLKTNLIRMSQDEESFFHWFNIPIGSMEEED